MLDALHNAIADGVQVELSYADRTGRLSTRTISPLGLAQKGAVWYLVANTDAGQRTFRVGRVTGVTRTETPVVRPDGFDLEEAWRAIVANVDELRSPQRVDAIADAEGWNTAAAARGCASHLLCSTCTRRGSTIRICRFSGQTIIPAIIGRAAAAHVTSSTRMIGLRATQATGVSTATKGSVSPPTNRSRRTSAGIRSLTSSRARSRRANA